jgi:predicted PurR-regulated permease PerM
VGLHPLLVFAALLISIKVAGFWGAFFGIPIAGVLWAMFVFFFGRWQKGEANSKSQHQNPK